MPDRDPDIDRVSPEDTLPDWLELVDHTADAGILVRAPDLPELFARAAWGMFCIITDPACVQTKETDRVTVEASDREALLVRWLSELNFRHVTRHFLYGEFSVSALSETQLTASAGGETIDPTRHTVYTEIKAVTFHELKLERSAEGWVARVIFDL